MSWVVHAQCIDPRVDSSRGTKPSRMANRDYNLAALVTGRLRSVWLASRYGLLGNSPTGEAGKLEQRREEE